jgi:hypothetical protein
MSAFKPPGQCPACGEWVPRGAVACDDCGACHQSGWKSDAHAYDGLDLPDEDFDYDDFIQREFGQSEGNSPRIGLNKEQFWRLVAAILLAVMILGYFISAR